MPREPGKLRAPVERIVSGGQTGVDRAALDWAIDRVLNVAGPRATGEAEAGAFARAVLDRALA